MIKKIAIIGSTGSIGQSTIKIIKENKKDFKILFLSTNNNVHKIYKQAKELNVKNVIINNRLKYFKNIKKFKKSKIKVYFDHTNIKKIVKGKLDYCMCAISGLEGLTPTLDAIKSSKVVGIANKESIICGWNLIEKNLNKYKTRFIPIDSEHFSIWSLLKGSNKKNIERIFITASGGPFLNTKINNFKKITPKLAIKHPNWNMGKKISVDSATLMNKVFEVIEAKKIFNINLKNFKILVHPKSYVHAIVKFRNGITKLLIHDTDMKIPIINSIYEEKNFNSNSGKLNLNSLNDLNFSEVNEKKFPSIKILKSLPNNNSLYETVIVSANDELVNLFLIKKIKFLDIVNKLSLFIKRKEFTKYKYKYPKNSGQIKNLARYVRLKVNSLCI